MHLRIFIIQTHTHFMISFDENYFIGQKYRQLADLSIINKNSSLVWCYKSYLTY